MALQGVPQVVPFRKSSVISKAPRDTNRSTIAYFSPEEISAVLKAARQRATRDWKMVLLAYRDGLISVVKSTFIAQAGSPTMAAK
jgi:hypothetical protein